MATFTGLLKDPSALCAALEAISVEGKLRVDLQRLYDSAEGFAAGRDAEQRLTGDTVRSCHTLGSRLGKHLRMKLPREDMMWLATVKRDRKGQERIVMRAEVRAVIKRLGWFGPGPAPAGSESAD
jgi:hypothetical protein